MSDQLGPVLFTVQEMRLLSPVQAKKQPQIIGNHWIVVSSIGYEDGVVNVQLCAAMLDSVYEELEPNIKEVHGL